MDMAVLFTHLDRIEHRESPLSPIRGELERSGEYTRTDQSCPAQACSGQLWDKDGMLVCGTCSMIKDRASQTERGTDPWDSFREYRPRYHNSNIRRLVGGFNHEWIESDDVDGAVVDLDPEEFYR